MAGGKRTLPQANTINAKDTTPSHPRLLPQENVKRRRTDLRPGPAPPQNEPSLEAKKTAAVPRTPPKHATTSPSHHVINSSLFANCCALVVPRDISRVRLRLMRELWVERGGELASALNDKVNIIIASVDKPQILEHLKLEALPSGVTVVLPEWISACINQNSLLDAADVAPRSPPKPVSQPATVVEDPDTQTAVDSDSDATDILIAEDVACPEGKPAVEQPAKDDNEVETISLPSSLNKSEVAKFDAQSLFDEIIQDMRSGGISGLAADAESSDSEDDGSQADAQSSSQSSIPASSSEKKPPRWQNKFLCMQSNGRKNLDEANKNAELTDLLNVLYERHDAEGSHFRALSYRKAIAALKRHPKTVDSGAEARKINGIGAKIADKIDEIIATGRLQKAEEIPESEPVLQLFRGIQGCGAKTAQKWYAQGYRTLQDLQSKATLSHNQALGVKYYDDLQLKMPRAEAAAIGDYVIRTLSESFDPKFQCMIMGSFRRGRPMCGDVDMIVTHPDGRSHSGILAKLLPALRKNEGLIVADLHLNSSSAGYQDTDTYMGICKLPGGTGIHRRLDIWTVPWDEMGSALLHFTGNDIFNRSMRALAGKKHMRLSQHGLFANVTRGKQRAKIIDGVRIASRTEEEIFEALGVPYRPPEERDV
ncbi:hypothetical protein HDU87_005755 [Geranomyces variabilis]|uniref:DNA polymerase n=1 Tax=Geranomyces variabilis TaxID=109894 RepID=A0AAD5XLG7_9FUNG|nr:hypothetical protein HDU87_005755 [Geranomyces variabilis]